MGNLEKNLFEKIVTPFKKETYLKGLPLDRNIEEEKIESPIEKNKQPDNYEKLRENLKSRKKGGGDVHFSQLKIANLTDRLRKAVFLSPFVKTTEGQVGLNEI